MTREDALASLVGEGVLGLITTGMYDAPLAIYREYIQNSVDAIQKAEGGIHGRIDIEVDPAGRRICIRDNGPGLSGKAARRALLPLARSEKARGTDRGFRGVGRLSGLAFAETVTFLTRSRGNTPLSRITWRDSYLRGSDRDVGSAIRDCVTVESIPGADYPDRFFQVEIAGVARHAAGVALRGCFEMN